MSEKTKQSGITRRSFLSKSAIGASGLVLGAPAILKSETKNEPSDTLKVGLLGMGKQGREYLYEAMKNLPGLRFEAVCDISQYNQRKMLGAIKSNFGYVPKGYKHFEKMLEAHKDLDAVIIASPDFWHAPHAVGCLEAGINVYCEKMMSNTIDGARSIVKAAEKSGKLCQIGHQRRSNPRYLHTYHQLLNGAKICGDKIININGQWNRSLEKSQDIKASPKILPDQKTLTEFGFKDAHQYLNWRWYRDLSGGPISDLGAHQIDIFNWFLDTKPKSVQASGGNDYFVDREHFDNVMAIFEYEGKFGRTRAFYQVLTTTSAGGGFYESFMGTEGSINISEVPAYTKLYREARDGVKPWDELVYKNYLKKSTAAAVESGVTGSYASAAPEEFGLPGDLAKADKPHTPHLRNFFESVRGKETLNCDARHAFESEAPIFWVNPSALKEEKINLTEKHLSV